MLSGLTMRPCLFLAAEARFEFNDNVRRSPP
jgi:hypothetical protein